ncbi:hypothetical protein [Olsenella sp. An270]|uniref:hypothetical protein n=1 Tax=Olsenella sp. An270 TaxID=1965615 RepID=UPI000B37EC77|nr:hypothetical protein [Olsenella sp. An270]OUO58869.1 hypothetical protein B5F73_07600 [Olsenella sp. An270]
MDRHTLEQFRTRARKATLPEDVRESVLDEIRVEKGERARGPRRPRRERRGVTRRTFVRVGAVAAGGVAAFLGVSALMNHAAGKRGNWFALTAYAEGTEEPDGSRLALGETFGGRISWAGGVDPESDGDDLLMVHTELNLSCTGDNVDTLTYQLEGDSVGTSVDVYFKPGIWIFQSDYEGSGPVANFTVDYDSQDTQSLQALLTGRLAYYAIYANIPVPDDLVPVFLELQETEGTEEESSRLLELMNQVEVRAAELFAEELAKTTLVMTATFNDGSEQTKRYSFSPREDYTQIYANYLEEDWGAYLAGDDARRTELTQNPPSLYLITEAEG